jgi:kynurenine formamidase
MGYEATMYLLERGVRLTGTDAWSWDAPFVHTAQKYGEPRRQPDLGRPQGRPRHRLLPPREAAQPGGAAGQRLHISCFPHKIRGASAGWTRAVAIFDDALMALILTVKMPRFNRRRPAAIEKR